MNSSETQLIGNRVSGTLGAGMSSIVNGGNKTYYILEHCTASKFHQVGESQKIIVDTVELGRDPRCQVRYDENFKTVSKRHASIVRDGSRWKLVHLSATNSTLINGVRVNGEQYLQNGDYIQLSVNGPKLRFTIPSGSQSSISSIGMTQRLQLFSQQALRPYRTGLMIMGGVLLLAVAAIVYLAFFVNRIGSTVDENAKLIAEAIEQNKDNSEKADSLARQLADVVGMVDKNSAAIEDVKKMAQNAQAAARRATSRMAPTPAEFNEVAKNVFYMELSVYIDDDYACTFSGTAFLLADGRLVTAKHCIDVGYATALNAEYDASSALLNYIHFYQSDHIKYKFICVSAEGTYYQFEYSPLNTPWTSGVTDYGNATVTITDEDSGEETPLAVKVLDRPGADDDWAYVKTNDKDGLPFDIQWSSNLGIGTTVHILGFPRGVGSETISTKGYSSPNYCTTTVSHAGLYEGIILMSENVVDHGNSGGPAFAVRDGKTYVIGVVSGMEPLGARTGGATKSALVRDRIVPLSAMD